jgi:hypothetical protein
MRQEQVEDGIRVAQSRDTIAKISLPGKSKRADLGPAEIGLFVRRWGTARA